MIGTIFTITNKANHSRVVTFNDHSSSNFIALQSYPTFELEVRNDEMSKEGQHGVWDFFSFYGKRLITFEGVIVGNNEADVHTLKELMQSVLELPIQPTSTDDGTVIIKWTDPLGRAVQTEAKIATTIRLHRDMKQLFRLDFQFSLKSANPIIETQTLYEVDGLRGYPLSGITLPVLLPFTLPTNYINSFPVTNAGNTEADIVVKLYGSSIMTINNPTLTNLTTGKSITINVALINETKYVSINSQNGQVLDQDGNDLSGSIQSGSAFVRLQTGINNLFYSSAESTNEYNPLVTGIDPTEIIETDHRDAIL